MSADKKTVIHGGAGIEPGFSHWMIKFSSSQDPRDIGPIEYAYALMAQAAGLEMAETHLFRTKRKAFFGTRRFDRPGGRRVHVHTLAGLIHADHRHPSLDYDTVLRAAAALTKNVIEVEKVYVLACFNVLAHNRDDHAKNFSFLLDDRFQWTFAPAYDLTFSHGPGGEQSTMVLGEGRNPGVAQLRALGEKHELPRAKRLLASVEAAVARWKEFAQEAGVGAKSTAEIGKKLRSTLGSGT